MQMNELNNQDYLKIHESPIDKCTFVQDPYNECYCFRVDSHEMIQKAKYYCMENFIECEIYRRISKENEPWPEHLLFLTRAIGLEIASIL